MISGLTPRTGHFSFSPRQRRGNAPISELSPAGEFCTDATLATDRDHFEVPLHGVFFDVGVPPTVPSTGLECPSGAPDSTDLRLPAL